MLPDHFYDKWYIQAIKLENELLEKGWKYIGSGSSRRVLKRGNVVLKIPSNEIGVRGNKKEFSLYKENKNNRYAPCRLINHCLMMRAVEDLYHRKDLPSWAFELNDGPQVGVDKSGKILVYDYAEE